MQELLAHRARLTVQVKTNAVPSTIDATILSTQMTKAPFVVSHEAARALEFLVHRSKPLFVL